METPNYFAIIPANVRYDENLSASEKLMYAEISALAQKEGYCWASSNYFEFMYKVSRQTIYNWIKNLSDLGYIKTELSGQNGSEGRKIYLSNFHKVTIEEGREENFTGPVKKTLRGGVKKTLRKHTSSNKRNNKENISATSAEEANEFFFNSEERSSAAYELEALTRYEKICQLWKTSESQPIKKTIFKGFKKLSPEAQQKMLDYLQALPISKREILSKIWMGPFLKNKMFTPEVLEQEIKNQENFIKPYENGKRKIESPNHNTGDYSGGFLRRGI